MQWNHRILAGSRGGPNSGGTGPIHQESLWRLVEARGREGGREGEREGGNRGKERREGGRESILYYCQM